MVVLISALSLAGYVALNFIGRRYGELLLGFFGGLVSSTPTTLVYSRHGKSNEALAKLSAVVIVIANLVVLVRLGVVSSIVAPNIAAHILPVLASGLVFNAAFTFVWWRRISEGGRTSDAGYHQSDRDQDRAVVRRPVRSRSTCLSAASRFLW